MNVPKHLAIIMDGNGRWAAERGHQRIYGHVRGAKIAREVISECVRRNVSYLTLYTFSNENWFRPVEEVSVLMRILDKYLKKEQRTLMQENIRFRCIGDISRLPLTVKKRVEETVHLTRNNTGMTLVFALSYGARQEMVSAVQALAEKIRSGELAPNEISERLISENLESSFLPDPDLVIRTSGEFRVSNFLLWQVAYSEFFITKTCWPDFNLTELNEAFLTFSRRERRFGRVTSPESRNEENHSLNVAASVIALKKATLG